MINHIDAQAGLRRVAIRVKVKGAKRARLRIGLATRLIGFAAWVLGGSIEVEHHA